MSFSQDRINELRQIINVESLKTLDKNSRRISSCQSVINFIKTHYDDLELFFESDEIELRGTIMFENDTIEDYIMRIFMSTFDKNEDLLLNDIVNLMNYTIERIKNDNENIIMECLMKSNLRHGLTPTVIRMCVNKDDTFDNKYIKGLLQ
jgi:hypothetical protein